MEKPFNNPFGEALRDFTPSKGLDSPEVPKKVELTPGTYQATATFVDRKGKTQELSLRSVTITSDSSLETIEQDVSGKAAGLGLHNFGMDTYTENYPDGHPVIMQIKDEKGQVIHKFTRNFGGNGYVKKK
jgi:hypothetical protein